MQLNKTCSQFYLIGLLNDCFIDYLDYTLIEKRSIHRSLNELLAPSNAAYFHIETML